MKVVSSMLATSALLYFCVIKTSAALKKVVISTPEAPSGEYRTTNPSLQPIVLAILVDFPAGYELTLRLSAIGPYSQAILVTDGSSNCMIYAAGQIGLTPGDEGSLVEGGIKEETKQAMENIKAILKEGNSTFNDVLECTVLMADLEDEYEDFNTVYATYFDEAPPARAAVEVSLLPKGAR